MWPGEAAVRTAATVLLWQGNILHGRGQKAVTTPWDSEVHDLGLTYGVYILGTS